MTLKCGAALYGEEWKTPLADALQVSPRTVQRWAAGEYPVAAGAWHDIAALLAARHGEVGDLLQAVHRARHSKTSLLAGTEPADK